MTSAEDDLTPTDGLTNTWLEFERLERREDGAKVSFQFVDRSDGGERYISSMSVLVNNRGDGMEGMVARALDELILVLRQAVFYCDATRRGYRQVAAKIVAPDAPEADAR